MQRTRHSSLDFLGGGRDLPRAPPDDWAAFLTSSMTALATDDDPPSAASPSTATADRPRFGGTPLAVDTFAEDAGPAAGRKPRGGSVSESLTSSTGSSPSGAVAWRPLGRRLTAPHGSQQTQTQPQTPHTSAPHVPSSSTSSRASSASSGADNQAEHAFARQPAGSPPVRRLQHASSLRDVVSSCLSSSDSSLYDSSSSEEDASKLSPPTTRPPTLDAVDPSYAEACLPVLAALPNGPEGGAPPALSRSNSLAHVKSPVLSSRKDSQTWQLQDEEFLTSPRFGAALRGNNQLDSPPPPPLNLFGQSASAFLPEYASIVR